MFPFTLSKKTHFVVGDPVSEVGETVGIGDNIGWRCTYISAGHTLYHHRTSKCM